MRIYLKHYSGGIGHTWRLVLISNKSVHGPPWSELLTDHFVARLNIFFSIGHIRQDCACLLVTLRNNLRRVPHGSKRESVCGVWNNTMQCRLTDPLLPTP